MASASRLRVTGAVETSRPEDSENYDVFLSHRGSDTKKNFVSFLDKDLRSAGLQPFLDCRDIDKGEESWNRIERAIKTSPVALVIFSESFAESSWCLNELQLMLETPSIRVLPIFYKVKPSDLRNLNKGPFAAGFKKLLRKGRFAPQVVEKWKEHLNKASIIDGFEYKTNDQRLEADVVTEIVQTVLTWVNKPLPLAVGEHIFGVDQVADEVIQALDEKKKDKKEVVMLGLWGMGGIGKSTLARELFNRLRSRYAGSCYIEDVTDKVSQHDGVRNVQKQILECLTGCNVEPTDDKFKLKTILEKRLKGMRFLLVLDDVSDAKVMEFMITHTMLMGGSMCIVTSRDRHVFEEFSTGPQQEKHIHHVRELGSEDSKRLFTSYAFEGDKVKPGFEELVTDISKACGGVPLVLTVCGACLKGNNDVDAWEEMKKRLNDGETMDEEKIFKCLRISFESLTPKCKEMFLDIACGLLGQSVDRAKRVWKSSNWDPALGIPVLVDRALISVDGDDCFCMHDVMRDMGRRIEMEKEAGNRTRLWMPQSLALLEEDESLPDSLQVLIILGDYGSKHRDAISLDVSDMRKLRILICDHTIELTAVPANLRWFNWDAGDSLNYYDAGDSDNYYDADDNYYHGISLSKVPTNSKLVVLDFPCLRSCPQSCPRSCKESCLGDNVNVLGGLFFLEVLRLDRCKMGKLPSLHLLTKLQELDIRGSEIKEVPWLGDLDSLVTFIASGCEYLAELPDIRKLTKLRVLNLDNCKSINVVPGLSYVMPHLLELSSKEEFIEAPQSQDPIKLVIVRMEGWSERGPAGVANWVNLEELRIECCQGVDILDGLLKLGKLHKLHIIWSGFKDVSCLNYLTASREIYIESCKKLTILPDLHNLRGLEKLSIRACKSLRVWALVSRSRSLQILETGRPSAGNFPQLRTLNFDGVALMELPDLSLFPQLTRLILRNCSELGRLTSATAMTALVELEIYSCLRLQEVPDLSFLPQLSRLSLAKCSELGRLTIAMPMTALVELEIYSCSRLQELPDLSYLPQLPRLTLGNCNELGRLTIATPMTGLVELEIDSCSRLQELPDLSFLSQLTTLIFKGCSELGRLTFTTPITALMELEIYHCSRLQELSDLSFLPQLTRLILRGCSELGRLTFATPMIALEKLEIDYCSRLQIFPDLSFLHQLPRLTLGNVVNWEGLPVISP